jgi:dienelactone hydrolase
MRTMTRWLAAFAAVALAALPVLAQIETAVTVHNASDVAARRTQLLAWLWGSPGQLPAHSSSNFAIEPGVTWAPAGTANVASIDRFRFGPPGASYNHGYHVRPAANVRNELVIMHKGHANHVNGTCDEIAGSDRAMVQMLVAEGYAVLALYMARTSPEYPCTPNVDVHGQMFANASSPAEAMREFFEPAALSMSYLTATFPSYTRYSMVGLSGGGWATTVYAALDPRIKVSVPVAGSMPLNIRGANDRGDREQFEPAFYSQAGYRDLYVMGTIESGRSQLQILNRRDDCCFSERTYLINNRTFVPDPVPGTWDPAIRAYEQEVRTTLADCGGACGTFRLEIDEMATAHMTPWPAIHATLAELNGSVRATAAASRNHAIVRSAAGKLTHVMDEGATETPFDMAGIPTVVESAGRIDVIHRDTTNRLWHATYVADTATWTRVALLDGAGAHARPGADPVAFSTGPGQFEVVAADKDGVLQRWTRTGTQTTYAGAFGGTGIRLGVPALAFLAGSPATLDVVARTRGANDFSLPYNRALAHDRLPSGATTSTAVTRSFPALVRGGGVPRRWFAGVSGTLVAETFDGTSTWVDAAFSSPPQIIGSPSATAGATQATVFATTPPGELARCTFPYSGSATCAGLGATPDGAIAGTPVAVPDGAFVRSTNGKLWFFDGTNKREYTQGGGPPNVQARATTSTNVQITWTCAAGKSYVVQRAAAPDAWVAVPGSPSCSGSAGNLGDTVAANAAYLYRVGFAPSGPFGNVDVASTMVFTDVTLLDNDALAAHLNELKTAVDRVRALKSLPPVNVSASVGGVIVASSVDALRIGVLEAYAALGIPAPPTHPIVSGGAITASDFQQIRNAVN